MIRAAASELSTNVAAFCGVLRAEHGFPIGAREARDALRAIELVGACDANRFRTALRLVCCGTHEQTLAFERAFDAFFLEEERGFPQASYAPRHTRPGGAPAPPAGERRASDASVASEPGAASASSLAWRSVSEREANSTRWLALHARYSAAAGKSATVRLDNARVREMRYAAARFVRSVRLGRSRRLRATQGAGRFDLRRTIRVSLRTGGDPVELRFLGRPPRHPRFVVLIDGSRSMLDQTRAAVAFAAALCQRSARTHVFFFSTELCDVTRKLRSAGSSQSELTDLGEAWGGGTKIGANLARFVNDYAALLSRETLALIISDGLDAGDVAPLAAAMRELDRRCAGVVWLNPLADEAGYRPTAAGMRAALPFVSLLCSANDVEGFERLAARVSRTSRIRTPNR